MTATLVRSTAACTLAIGAMLNAGCFVVSSFAPTVKGNQAAKFAHVAGSPIAVESANGSIDVSTGGDEVVIDAEVRAATQERLDLTKVMSARQPDGTLRIWVEWPGGKREGNEGVSMVVRVPDAKGITAKTSNGSIKVIGLGGDAELRTSNGSVRSEGQGGAVTIDTSNASVNVLQAAGAVRVDTSNGRVVVSDAPSTVFVDTSNGSVEVSLAPTAAGPVNIDTSNGGIKLFLSRAFAGQMTLDTSNGSIRLPATATVLSKSRNRASVRFGDDAGAKPSHIDTSNASITVEVR